MRNNPLTLLLCLLLPLLAAGCHNDVISSAHADIAEQGWSMTDTVSLALNVADTAQTYDLALMLRHTDEYTYQNLWLFVMMPDSPSLAPDGVWRDTVQACLADDRGRWLGTHAGRYYSGYVTMESSLHFPAAGSYTFAIVHGMRDTVIFGIADVGLELRKHN